MDNAPPQSPKVRCALFQLNSSLNQDSCNSRHDYPFWRRTKATFTSKRAKTMVKETLDASSRWNKCKLKREKFNRKFINEALSSRPSIILARTERNLENRANYEMSQNMVKTKDGKEPDKLELFEVTNKPKWLETKRDDASTATLKDFPSYEHGLPASEDEFVLDGENDQDV
ncbi:hypothetical protein Cgig2_024397 [Carnegiea gigantea]|uniref:Uncharacterized protein n=1 Tax=Carnegiea gigantea TaxID=171969 RepID=A0A9Q1GMK4_9CARY|nr:hypothetical protein Cgig2_024397 [Carnegiea gigantea]